MTPSLSTLILAYLHDHNLGPSRAIPRDRLMGHFGMDPRDVTADRAFREWYSGAGIAVCERGLFIPRNPEDVEDCRCYLWAHMSPDRLRARIERIYKAWPRCRPETGEQLELQTP